jgi:hypothetical protein
VIVRWLGAFGKADSIANSLAWELSTNTAEVCAESFRKGDRDDKRSIPSRIGLLVPTTSLHKKWAGDVWSYRQERSKSLRKSRSEHVSNTHTECWVKPGNYTGIVIRGLISREALKEVCFACLKHGLPLYRLNRDNYLMEMEIVQ